MRATTYAEGKSRTVGNRLKPIEDCEVHSLERRKSPGPARFKRPTLTATVDNNLQFTIEYHSFLLPPQVLHFKKVIEDAVDTLLIENTDNPEWETRMKLLFYAPNK